MMEEYEEQISQKNKYPGISDERSECKMCTKRVARYNKLMDGEANPLLREVH